MALNNKQQAAFNRRINSMKEDGFFLPATRSLSGDTRYLIVSFGGTGADALFGVKKQFETILPPAELDSRVRFLAIDTDPKTQKYTKEIRHDSGNVEVVELDALTNDQFFQLQGSTARLVIDSDDNITQWINPQLRARILQDNELLSGNGASGTRQIGRLTLYPAINVAALTAKIKKLVGELTFNNHYPLRVFILSGIAGGTGSGTIVDLTYLIRNVIEHMPGDLDSPEINVPTRTKYCGFILLPPTGTSTSTTYIERGNRNGYAALKEINHFMNIDSRNGGYSLTYGDGRTVESFKKIFDICYLLDGTSGGVIFENARKQAIRVLAECMLDMITASQAQEDGTSIQAVDSFMNDQSTTRMGMVAGKPIAHAMRDADYVYCALGHSEFSMPANEIKAYVAKQMFEKIHALFQMCSNVEQEDVEEFLKRIIRRGATTESSTRKVMDEELDGIFRNLAGRKGGPYFAINLLRDVIQEINRQKNKVRLMRLGMATDEALDYIQRYALYCNNTTFEVYTAVLEALKGLFSDQYGAVVLSGKHGNSYSFIPESLGSAQSAGKIVEYLDDLVNSEHLRTLCNALLEEMINNREAWTDLIEGSGVSAAPAAMRRFWNTELDKLVRATMEDFLIKYFSGNSEAYYDPENHNATLPYLQAAANAVYNQMLGAGGEAHPMVGLTGQGLNSNDFNGHTYLLVPETAPNLYAELKTLAAGAPAGNQVKVCTSLASDRISCYKQYTCIPAFKLAWVCAAEADYEKGIKAVTGVGVHMSETAGGNQWRNFPNLLPRSTWKMLPKADYFNSREAKLADRAETLFNDAMKLDLTVGRQAVAGTPNLTYSVKVLPAEYRPDDMLFREVDRLIDGSADLQRKLAEIERSAESCAAALFTKLAKWDSTENIPLTLQDNGVAFVERELFFADSVLTVGPADRKPEGWDEYMAQCMLRKLPTVTNEVNGTVMVMKKLFEKVQKSVQASSLIKVFAQYLVTDMFQYDEVNQTWQYQDENGFPVDLAFIATDLEKLAERYIMFNAFRENPDAIIKATSAAFAAKVPGPGATDRVQKIRSFIQKSQTRKDEMAEWLKNPPIAPYAQVLVAMGYDVNAIRNFHRALFEEFKTMALAGYIPVAAATPKEDPIDTTPDYLF